MTAVDAPALTSGDLLSVIRHAADTRPRSLQKAIGPSGVGMLCQRRLSLQLLDAPVHNTTIDPWPSTVGVAVHAWLAEAFTAENARLVATGQPPRWLVEQPVTIRTGLSGSCDLYDLETHTAVDWKNLGSASLKAKRRDGHPGRQYAEQCHLYGMGWANAGLPVRAVAVVCLPKSGILRDAWTWSESYDPAIAQQALDRMDSVLSGMDIAEGMGALDEFVGLLERDTAHCDWCPWFTADRTVPASEGCNGPLEDLPPGAPIAPLQAVPGIA